YGEPSGKRFAFPERPAQDATNHILTSINNIKSRIFGQAIVDSDAKRLLEKLYSRKHSITDQRFESYFTRRHTQLIKLCLIVAASELSCRITETIVRHANTILSFTEQFMPKALGQFGKAKNSDVSHKVLAVIDNAKGVIGIPEIWANVHSDLEKVGLLSEILNNLIMANKIQTVNTGNVQGFIPKKGKLWIDEEGMEEFIDMNILTEEEKGMTL
ncbi:MAG: hypothetical protein ACRDBG_26780, partial [Waterburya sp.]